MNISSRKAKPITTRRMAQLFRMLGQPTRLRILLAIGLGEACVCHLETALGLRQAYISQQLMALRRAGLVRSRRSGRNIFYALSRPDLLEIIQQSGIVLGIPQDELSLTGKRVPLENCPCPHCVREVAP